MTNQASVIAKTIIDSLKKSGNISEIVAIVDALRSSSEYKNGSNHVIVTSALALDKAELKNIRSYLSKSIGDAYEMVELVDPGLVAGFTLQVNDTFIDASVLGKINSVSNKLTAKD